MVVDGVVIVEVKAIRRIGRIHEAVMLSYLRSTGIRVGLILNFRGTLLRDGIRRVVV
jgi:GxxExxY protein